MTGSEIAAGTAAKPDAQPTPRPPVRAVAKTDNLNAEAYLAAGTKEQLAKKNVLAHTLFRCAQTLGAEVDPAALQATRLKEPQLLGRGVVFQRNQRVVDLIEEHFGTLALDVVDIGGGTGLLSHMMPEARYMLSEPSVNSLFSHDLVAAGHQFDIAIAVHVFEHIPADDRAEFFESLLALGRRGVVLGVPVDTGRAVERQKFLLDVYGPLGWIVEHLECGTPGEDLYRDYAKRYDLDLTVHRCGNSHLSMAMFAMNHFAQATKDPAMIKKSVRLQRYINQHYNELDSEISPRDFTFVFKKKS